MTTALRSLRTPVIIALVLLLAIALTLALVVPVSGMSWAGSPDDMTVAGASWSGPRVRHSGGDFGDFTVMGASWS
jgi:hypothetical protein